MVTVYTCQLIRLVVTVVEYTVERLDIVCCARLNTAPLFLMFPAGGIREPEVEESSWDVGRAGRMVQ